MLQRGFFVAFRLPEFGVALVGFGQTQPVVILRAKLQRFVEIFFRQAPIILASILLTNS